jgi:hypothetical protein
MRAVLFALLASCLTVNTAWADGIGTSGQPKKSVDLAQVVGAELTCLAHAREGCDPFLGTEFAIESDAFLNMTLVSGQLDPAADWWCSGGTYLEVAGESIIDLAHWTLQPGGSVNQAVNYNARPIRVPGGTKLITYAYNNSHTGNCWVNTSVVLEATK